MIGKSLKATVAFAFTALASLMMLTGSILPHHHHGGAFCIDLSHCRDHGSEIPGRDCHEHDANTHTDSEICCTLNVNYYLHEEDENPTENALLSDGNTHTTAYPDFSLYILPDTRLTLALRWSDGAGCSFAAIDRIQPYDDFHCGACGRRGPPVFIA